MFHQQQISVLGLQGTELPALSCRFQRWPEESFCGARVVECDDTAHVIRSVLRDGNRSHQEGDPYRQKTSLRPIPQLALGSLLRAWINSSFFEQQLWNCADQSHSRGPPKAFFMVITVLPSICADGTQSAFLFLRMIGANGCWFSLWGSFAR